jgi:capsular polysaccharide biosynthesis protein
VSSLRRAREAQVAVPAEVLRPAVAPAAPLFDWRRLVASPLTVLVMVSMALGLLAGGLGAAYVHGRPSAFRSDATLLIDQGPALGAAPDSSEILKLARLRIKYAGIVDSVFFEQPVADRMRLPLRVVQRALTTTVDPGTLVLRMSATMPDPAQARQLVQTAAQYLVSFVRQEQDAYDVPRAQQIDFAVLTPSTPAVRTAPDPGRTALVGVVLFVVVSVVGFRSTEAVRRHSRRLRS